MSEYWAITDPETFGIIFRDRHGNLIDTSDYDYDKMILAGQCYRIEKENYEKQQKELAAAKEHGRNIGRSSNILTRARKQSNQ